MHGLVKFPINFLLHGLTQLLHLHHMEYNCAIYTTWLSKSYLSFTQHGNNKTNFLSKILNIFPPCGLTQLLPLHTPGMEYKTFFIDTTQNTVTSLFILVRVVFALCNNIITNILLYTVGTNMLIQPFQPSGLIRKIINMPCTP